jgi:NDP-hexose 3,5-(Or5-) epimerase
MEIRPLAVPDAYRITPSKLADSRGCFYEALRYDTLLDASGHSFTPQQVNCSVSRRGTIRGIHGVLLPPAQAKFVSCIRGAVVDIVVDLRLGSPTYGRYDVSDLNEENGTSVYLAEGHAFLTLAEDTCIQYVCSTMFVPGTQVEVDPLDPELALPWPLKGATPLMSEKDANAPSLREAAGQGLLSSYADCQDLYAANLRDAQLLARTP